MLEFGRDASKIAAKAYPMIELKVYCDCGQKYKFDVEPVNGQMPFTVACPICKRDGTAKANEMLTQMAVFKPIGSEPSTAPAPAPVAPPTVPAFSGAPALAAPPSIGAPPPPPVGASKLRISHAAPATAPSGASPPPGPMAPPTISAPGVSLPPAGGRSRLAQAAVAAAESEKKGSFAMGLLGAFVGALVGATIYFFIFKATGPMIFVRYFLALGVGGLAGWLASLMGKGEGSKELGGLAAVFTVIGIITAQYFIQVHQFRDNLNDSIDSSELTQAIQDGGYTESVKESKKVVAAIPNGSDGEIRMYLAKQQAEEGQPPKLETISNDEVKQFRETELTNYQDLASGKLTKEQYWAKNNFDPKAAQKALDAGRTAANVAVSGAAVIVGIFRAGIFSMIFAAGLAFRLGSNP